MYYIYFANAPIVDATIARQCYATEHYDALVVFEALCMKFLVVELYDEDGTKVLDYCNL